MSVNMTAVNISPATVTSSFVLIFVALCWGLVKVQLLWLVKPQTISILPFLPPPSSLPSNTECKWQSWLWEQAGLATGLWPVPVHQGPLQEPLDCALLHAACKDGKWEREREDWKWDEGWPREGCCIEGVWEGGKGGGYVGRDCGRRDRGKGVGSRHFLKRQLNLKFKFKLRCVGSKL